MNIKMPNDPPNTTNMPMAVSEKAISEYLEARNLPAATQGNILSAVKEAIIKIATSGHADWDTIIDNNTILSCSPRMFKEAKKNLGWSYVRLPAEIRKAMKLVRDKIDIDDLGEDGKEGHPHITAKYGLTVKNPEEVKNATIGNRGGKVRMGKTSLFENEDCDVLKVSVTSHALHALWKSLSELPNEDKHDEYIPHATLAYLKKGTGKKYRNLDDLDGMEFVFDAFVFQDACDVKTEIILDGEPIEASVGKKQVRTAQFDIQDDLSWMGDIDQEQDFKAALLQDRINRQRFFVETYDLANESWVKMSSITVEEGEISGEFTSQEEAQKAINQHADKGNYPMSLFRIVSTEFGPLIDEKPELFYIQELRDNEWKRIDLRLDENDARQMIEYYKKRRARSSETADVRIVSSKRGVLDSTSEQQTTEDAEEIQLATNPRAVPLGIPSRPTESFLANMEHGRTYAWEFKRNTRHYRNGNPTEGRFDRQRSGHILSFSPINNAVVGVDEDTTFWIDSRSIRRIWPVRTSVSSVNKKILTSQFLDDENDFEIAIHELEPPVQPSSDATTADNTTPDRSESDGAIAIDGENFYPPFSPQFQDSDGEWLDISSMTFQNPLEALWDANAYAASTNTRVRVVDSRGGEFVPSLEHSFSSEYINVNNHPDITGEHEYTLRNNRTSVWSNLVYQTYDEAQISKQRMGGDWRIVPCKHQIEARVRLSPTAPYQEWEDAGFEDDNGNTFLFSHLSEALSAIQDFRANHHGANLVDFRVIPIPLNHIVTNAKTKSSIKKAQFEDEDDFEIAIHELEPFSYSSPKKDAQPRMPSGSYKRGTEIFELLKNTGGTDWEPIGSSDNLQDAAMVVNSAVSRGDSFFDYGVSSSFVGPVPLFMIQKKNGNNEMEGTDNPIVFATRPKAEQALDELYGDGYHIISTYADDPRNNTSRFLVKQLTPQGWVSAWSIASSYASFNDAWKDIQECMFHRPENMFMVIDAEYDCPVRINPPQQINIYWQNSKGSWELAHRYSDMQEARERFTALRNNNPSSHYSVEIIPSETQSREASQQGLRKQAQFEDDDDFEIAVHELDPPSRSNPYFNSVQPLTDIPQEPIEPNGPYRIEKVVEDGQFGETTNRHPVNELLNKQFPSLEKAKAALWSILSCPSQNPADFNILKRNNAIVPSSEWWNEIVSPLQYAIQIRPPNEHNWKFLEGQGYLPSPTYELAKIAVDRMINNGIITNHPENVRIVPIHSLGQTRSTDLVPENEATWTYTVEPLGPYSNAPAGSVRVVFKRNNESIANTIGERPDKALNAVLKRLNIGLPITGRGSNRTRIMAPYELEILRQNNKFSDASTRYYTNYNMSSREGEVWRKSKRSFSNPDDAILDSVATMANRIGTWTSDARQIRVTQGDNNEIDLSNSFVVVNHIPSTPEEAVYTPSNVPREDMQPLRKVFHDWKEAVDAAIRWSTENNISIHAFSIADVDRQKIYPLGWLAKVRRESLASDSVQAMSINKTIKQAQFDNDDSFNISFLQEAEQEFQERTMLFNREKFQIQCRTDHGWITPEDGIKNLFFNEQDARKAVPQFVQQMFPQGRTSSNIDKFRIFGSRQGVIPLTLFKVTFSTKNINQTPVTLNLGNFLTKEKAQQAIEDHKARFKRLPDTYKIVEGTTSDNWPVVDGSDGEPEKFFVQYSKKQEVYKFVEQDGKPQEFPSKEQAFEKQFELLKTNNPPYATRIISSLTGLVDNRDASTNQTDRIEFTGPYILESWYDANITPGNRWVASRERYEEPDQAWGAAANIVRSTNARATGFRVKDSRNNLLPRPPFFGEQDPPNVANPWVVQYKTPDAPSSAAWNTLQECSTQEEARNVMTSRSRLDSYMVFRLVNTDGPVPRVIDQTTSSVSGHYFPKVLDALSNGFVLLEGDENRTYHTEEAAWAGAKQWMRNRGLNPDATSIMVIGPGGSTHIIPPEHWNDNNETNEPRPTRLTPANLEQQGRRIFDRFENSAFGRQTMIDAAASINDEAKLTFLTLNFATWYRRERQEDEPFAYRIMPYIRSILRTIVASQSSTQSNN